MRIQLLTWSGARPLLAAAACLPALAGCGNKHRTYPVEGSVVWSDGTPAVELAGGFVTFDSAPLLLSARGIVRKDGTFVLGTYGQTDGVPAGSYKVAVTRPPAEEGAPSPPLPTRYDDVEKSGLTAVVQPNSNSVTLRVEKSKKAIQYKPTLD